LVSRGHEVTVFAVNPPAEPASYSFSPVLIPPVVDRFTPYVFSLALAKLALDDFDVVHSHGDDHFLRIKPPLVRTFHGSSWGEARSGVKRRHRLYHYTMGCPAAIAEWRTDAV